MPRSRPASSPLSFHSHTGQYYVTRGGRRQYLGADADEALAKYHRQELGLPAGPDGAEQTNRILPAKELANRFIAAQQANWRSPNETRQGYRNWLRRFLMDHPRLQAQEFTVEMFASWKLSLRDRGYSPRSINHFLSAVRAMYRFAEEAQLLEKPPRLTRVKNESRVGPAMKELYQLWDIRRLLAAADLQLRTMILLGLNCGFGPKDIQDLTMGRRDSDGQ